MPQHNFSFSQLLLFSFCRNFLDRPLQIDLQYKSNKNRHWTQALPDLTSKRNLHTTYVFTICLYAYLCICKVPNNQLEKVFPHIFILLASFWNSLYIKYVYYYFLLLFFHYSYRIFFAPLLQILVVFKHRAAKALTIIGIWPHAEHTKHTRTQTLTSNSRLMKSQNRIRHTLYTTFLVYRFHFHSAVRKVYVKLSPCFPPKSLKNLVYQLLFLSIGLFSLRVCR